MATSVPQVYLDTSIIQPILFPGGHRIDDVSGSHDIRDKLRGAVSNSHVGVSIPEVALGEAVSNYLEDNADPEKPEVEVPGEFIDNLVYLVDHLQADFPGMTRRGVRFAQRLVADDRDLGYNDAYIAACAIDDVDSQRIISKDPDLVDSDTIPLMARELRRDRRYELVVSYEY